MVMNKGVHQDRRRRAKGAARMRVLMGVFSFFAGLTAAPFPAYDNFVPAQPETQNKNIRVEDFFL